MAPRDPASPPPGPPRAPQPPRAPAPSPPPAAPPRPAPSPTPPPARPTPSTRPTPSRQAPAPPPDDTPTRALAGPGRHSRPRLTREQLLAKLRAQLPFLVVISIVVAAFARIALHHWREGATEIGMALLVAALLRARTTRTGAGLLAVRGRRVDIVTYAVAGVVLVLVALTITGGPLATR